MPEGRGSVVLLLFHQKVHEISGIPLFHGLSFGIIVISFLC
ncbi:MAG: hypothetical protein Q4A67_03140 [Aerococcus sp.]|nr:hypothetical protein [Aerococcus sp.]